MKPKIKILIPVKKIKKRISELGKEITDYYKNKVSEDNPLVAIVIQKGAGIFGADLIREIKLPLDLRFMRVASYRGKTSPQGDPEIFDKIQSGIRNDHVLVVEDILDTGKTLAFVDDCLQKLRPASLSFAVLLIKTIKRQTKIPKVKFKAFKVANEFVVGYGLDYNEIYRNLPYVGILKNNNEITK